MPASASPLPPDGPIAIPAAKPTASMPTASAPLALREGTLEAGRPCATEAPGLRAAASVGFQNAVKSMRGAPRRSPQFRQ